ncbi:MAG: hypothetical protein HY052_06985, partial [Proteobacteria bacterium]|nr:hypothetical protein [Pseudomonadota bacterium]
MVEYAFMNKKIAFWAAAALMCALSACSQYGGTGRQLVAEPDPVALRLASAADRASSALQTLASVEQARNPAVAVQAAPDAP